MPATVIGPTTAVPPIASTSKPHINVILPCAAASVPVTAPCRARLIPGDDGATRANAKPALTIDRHVWDISSAQVSSAAAVRKRHDGASALAGWVASAARIREAERGLAIDLLSIKRDLKNSVR
jgi:hypothetical protein